MAIKNRVLTGITTSGIPHIGNLCGAILPAIQASKNPETESFLFMADYHSLIKNNDPSLTHNSCFEIAACWLACGLDPNKVIFYRQSDIPHIMELTWILGCLTSKGLMNRAHAYKAAIAENSNKDPDKGITMGLFNYPILMAADILMFNADIVPVGKDQTQHLEMTRDIATRFNHHYEEIFSIPNALIDDNSGVIPGIDGRKMSKSYKNVIPIFLSTDQLRKSIMKIKTDSKEPGEPKEIQGSSIFEIYQAFATKEQLAVMESKYKEGVSWGEAKQLLFELLEEKISPLREKYDQLLKEPKHIEKILITGAEKALNISTPLIKRVREAVGIKGFKD